VFFWKSQISPNLGQLFFLKKDTSLVGDVSIGLVTFLLSRSGGTGVAMKIALSAWAGQISPVFDSAEHVVLLEMQRGKVVSQTSATFGSRCITDRVAELKTLGADTLICGAVSRPLAEMLKYSGIKVIPFVSGEVRPVIDAFLNGVLPSQELTMPGCWRRRGRCRQRHRVPTVRQDDPAEQSGDRADGGGSIQKHE
jgi:predicted Fe-Mo cluster-binding NifX family protein